MIPKIKKRNTSIISHHEHFFWSLKIVEEKKRKQPMRLGKSVIRRKEKVVF